MRIIGVDTGGTFTDLVLLDGGALRVHKVSSTPDAPERAIVAGIAALAGPAAGGLAVVHGSTVATNALLEGRGARTAFVTNRGFADLLLIGRQARRKLFDLAPPPAPVLVPPELCLETGGRLDAQGRLVEPFTAADRAALTRALEALAPEAVAVDLLFSFLAPAIEREVGACAPSGCFTTLSHEVLPTVGEYERGVATVIAARLGPTVAGYLQRLAAGLAGVPISVMQSSGQTVAAEVAARRAVHLLLSGPAGGLAGAARVAAEAGIERALSFDMGGTSTDVAFVAPEGAALTEEGEVAGLPIAVPMVDIHTIGAGGGSLAWLDAGGMLCVGPRSAGAAPGPACYGRGGREPTVTDANLVLGRLVPDAFLGGALALDRDAAERAVATIARGLGLPLARVAEGIVALADAHMVNALRVMSVQRGRDPRALALLSFGGAGGLHVCALAEALGMTRALVPARAGVLSAYGMLAAPRGREFARSAAGLDGEAALERAFAALEAEGRAALAAEGVIDPVVRRRAALRYRGQQHALTSRWQGQAAAVEAFHAAHRARYGHALDMEVEVRGLTVAVESPLPDLGRAAAAADGLAGRRFAAQRVHGAGEVPVLTRDAITDGTALDGPALVVDAHSTTWLAPGWRARADSHGHLHLVRTQGAPSV
jgi:N-methylhydantoinase A